jgi:hypothetical protein
MNSEKDVKRNNSTIIVQEGVVNGSDGEEQIIDISTDDYYILAVEKAPGNVLSRQIFQVRHPGLGWSASLDVEYSFNSSGTVFTCHAKRYRAGDNGRKKGNVHFGFEFVNAWVMREISDDNAIQDNNWHDISGGGSVSGFGAYAYIKFKFIYDVPFPLPETWVSVNAPVQFNPPMPEIRTPTEGWSHVGHGQLNGTCVAGAEMRARFINGTPPEAPVYVLGNSWAYRYEWPPGMHQFQVRQTVNGQMSEWTPVLTFYIKPPIPPITEPEAKTSHLADVLVKGTCMAGATVAVWDSNNKPLAGTLSYNGGTWSFAYPWLPGAKHIRAVQTLNGQRSAATGVREFYVKPVRPVIKPPSVPATATELLIITGVMSGAHLEMFTEAGVRIDGTFKTEGTTSTFTHAGSWLLGTTRVKVTQTVTNVRSDDSALVAVSVKPPAPAITLPEEGQGYNTLEVQGTCEAGATVNAWSGGTHLGTIELTGTNWRNRFAWQPGPKVVHAIQTVRGMESDPSVVINFTVKPPPPTIVQPPNPTVAKQVLSLTDVWASASHLQMYTEAGDTIAGDFSSTGTTSTFTPQADWASGISKVQATQVVNTVASDFSELVTLTVKPEAPQITLPKQGESYVELQVQGTCASGATVAVWSGGTGLGAGKVVGTRWTNDFDWQPGPKIVQARQTVAGQNSPDSEEISFSIKPPKPMISPPPNPAAADEALIISGVWNGDVTLALVTEEGVPIAGDFTTNGENSTFKPMAEWAPGATSVKVMQTVNGVASDFSELVTLTVKPEAPQITLPKQGESYVELQVQGTCASGATVAVWSGGTDLGAGKVVGMRWTVDFPWLPGPKIVQARQTVAGQNSPDSDEIRFSIKPPNPMISPPPNPAAADEALLITGVWDDDVTLAMFTEEGVPIAGDFTTSGENSTFTPTNDWEAGINTVKVVQTVNTVGSDPSDVCTFTVEAGEKPDAPYFELPMASDKTSTRPLVRAVGLPGALLTVQRAGAETLHSGNADGGGILEFTVETPLTPGENALRVNQKAGGPVSDWSEPRRFTVKELPQTPTIDAPKDCALSPRKPIIRGKGQTRGKIALRHVESEEMIVTLDGVSDWRWTAKEAWGLGSYTIQAQQTDDGDSSEWTEPRRFEVVDALFGIGDATPVLANPVVGSGRSVMLRVQVLAGDSGEAAEGVNVQWRLKGQEDVLATSVSQHDGWAYFAYTPEIAGKTEVVADITSDNAGVVMTELYEVNARLQDDWAQVALLTLRGQTVDLALRDLVLPAGKTSTLQLTFKKDHPLWGTYVTLHDLWGAAEGLTVVPALGTPQKVDAPMLFWSITPVEGQREIFGLRLTSPVLSDWQLPGRVITGDFARFLDVDLDTYPQVFGGEAACPCTGATHTLTVRPKADSPMLGLPVLLELSPEAADLGVTVSPGSQIMKEDGVRWLLDCGNSSKSGNFATWLVSLGWGITSTEMPMSLGHNKVEITESDGPWQIDGRWRYGIRVTSAFSGQPAGDVPVTITISGSGDVQRSTQPDGWIYVHYDDGQTVSFSIHNGYDGTTVTG